MLRRLFVFISAVVVLLVVAGSASAAIGFRALTGAEAARFVVPNDTRLVQTLELRGLTYERYQQFHGSAAVLSAQLTVYRDSAGTAVTVIGAYYADVTAKNRVRVSRADARATAARDVTGAETRSVDLLINPKSGRYFFQVESRGFALRWFHWVDAASGKVITRWNGLESDHGVGVKGDVKDMNGTDNVGTADDLTTFHSSSGHGAKSAHWDLFSKDNRQKTYDAKNRNSQLFYVTDADNHWTQTGRTSPGQPALVDAQYYANVTDDYFLGRHGLSWTSCYSAGMQSVAHYKRNYNNAFWNGTYTVYGDGDGAVFREFSGGLDVVSHEHTHGVTDCTSNLVYQNESGALNEAFSDILGNSAEFFAAANGLDAAPADWWIGEDVYLAATTIPGFRNMADPAEDNDPDHYSERYTGTDDNGGVHSNSGIPNHAYYLLVNGGSNAGEARGHAHSGPVVTGIGLADAERIFFLGFTGLPSSASMCQARLATVAQAESIHGSLSQQKQSTQDAWEAVGVTAAGCGA
jgi:bacillolysin